MNQMLNSSTISRGVAGAWVQIARAAVRAIWPGKGQAAGALPAADWAALTFLTGPGCEVCGHPFDHEQGAHALCLACLGDRPRYDRARAALAYDDASRKLILPLKHAAQFSMLAPFAAWMAHAAGDLLADVDIIAPTPLALGRLAKRGYNQAGLLATALADHAGRTVDPMLLIRHRPTRSMGGLSRAGRKANVAGAFRLAPGREVRGKSVLLVDDVMTTGATIEACARRLKRDGARRVDAVVLARVVRARQVPI
jgi:ComF family protein